MSQSMTTPTRGPMLTAAFLTVAMAATVGSALAFQYIGGYIPCKLCYEQRIPYYVGVPLMFSRCLPRSSNFLPGSPAPCSSSAVF